MWFFSFLNYCSITVAPIIPPLLSSTLPTLTSHLQSYPPTPPPTLSLSTAPLHMFLDDSSPSFPRYPHPDLPMVIVSSFFISMCLVPFCSVEIRILGHVGWERRADLGLELSPLNISKLCKKTYLNSLPLLRLLREEAMKRASSSMPRGTN